MKRRSTRAGFLIVPFVLAIMFLSNAGIVVGASSSGGNWTSFTLDYSDSRYQASSTINATNVGLLTQRWMIPTGSSVSSTPIVQNGTVFFADWKGDVYSANVTTGLVNWKVNVGAAVSSTVDLANGLVYVGLGPLGPTKVVALSQSTGALVWTTKLNTTMNSIWASPIYYHGLVYVGVALAGSAQENNASRKGEIDALNGANGALVWRFQTSVGDEGGAGVWGSVVVDPVLNSIYFGTGNSYVSATNSLYGYSIISLDASSGALNWYYQVYKAHKTGHDKDFGSTPNLFSLTVSGTTHFAVGLGSKDGTYYIIDRVTGKLLEKVPVGNDATGGIRGLAGFINLSPGVPEIFVPSDYKATQDDVNVCCGVVKALLPSNSNIAWTFSTPGSLTGSVTVVPGAVLFGDTNGNLYAVNSANGVQLFQTRLPYGIQAGVTVANGYALVGNFDPNLGSSKQLGLYAFAVESVKVSCNTVDQGYASTCTADVSGRNGILPTGTVAFKTNGHGKFTPTNKCKLNIKISPQEQKCSVKFYPSAPGTQTVTGQYSGDANYSPKAGTYGLTANPTLVAPSISSSGAIDQGQSSTLTSGTITTGTSPYQYQWYQEAQGAGSYSPISGATSPGYTFSTTTLTQAGLWSFELKVTDADGAFAISNVATVAVSTPLVAGAIAPPNPTIDGGQAITLTSQASGGSPSLSYQWYSDTTCTTAIPGATSPTYVASPSSASSYSYQVTDSANPQVVQCSPSDAVSVNPVLVAGGIYPTTPTIDIGQSITLTANPAGGSGPYTYQWYDETGCTSPISGATSPNYVASPSSATTYSYQVTDSAYSPTSACSPDDAVSVNPALTAGAIAPSAPTIDSGSSITLTANPSGGTPGYSYQWYSDGACGTAIPGATSSSYPASPTASATYSYLVTDSAFLPLSACSPGDTVSVNAALVAGTIIPSTPTIDNGTSITLTAAASGGTTPYSYQWYDGTSPACSSDTSALGMASTESVSPTSNTYYCYMVTDASSGTPSASATSSADLVKVSPALSTPTISTNSSIVVGQSVTITASWSGGTPAYTVELFTTPTDCSGTLTLIATNTGVAGSSTTFTQSPTNTTTYCASVIDSAYSPVTQLTTTAATVVVLPALAVGSNTPSAPITDNGQSPMPSANCLFLQGEVSSSGDGRVGRVPVLENLR